MSCAASSPKIAAFQCAKPLVATEVPTVAPSPAHRCVNQFLQLELNPTALRRCLHHENHEHVVDGIDEEELAGNAVPAIFAERPLRVRPHRDAHGKAEAETA